MNKVMVLPEEYCSTIFIFHGRVFGKKTYSEYSWGLIVIFVDLIKYFCTQDHLHSGWLILSSACVYFYQLELFCLTDLEEINSVLWWVHFVLLGAFQSFIDNL